MQYLKSTSFRWSLLVIVANFLLTAWTVYTRPTLDYDAILYITAAKAIANNDWQLSSELYKGSFYPYLIYLSQKLSGFSFEIAAHLLNAIFFSLISFGFIAVVGQLGGRSNTIRVISLTLILFFPSIIKYRPDIFREFGFLSCYFWSIYCLLEFNKTNKSRYLFFWFLLLSVGVLFRMESAILLLSLSLVILAGPIYKKLSQINKKVIFIGLLAGLFILGLLFSALQFLLNDTSTLHSILSYPIEYIERGLSILKQKLVIESGGLIGAVKFIAECVLSIVAVILERSEIIYALLAIVAYKSGLVLREPENKKVIVWYLSISLLTLILFQLSYGYLTARYALIFVLTTLLLVPFVLQRVVTFLLQGTNRQKCGAAFLCLLLCFLSVKRLEVSNRNLEINAGRWLLDNAPQESIIASNNSKVLYYANRFPYITFKNRSSHNRFTSQLLLSDHNHNFKIADYVALKVSPESELDISVEEELTIKYGEPIQLIKQQNRRSYVAVFKSEKSK